ncbi:uncharacterized protein [Apostichopus japonicus]|uniref:uncharacterized protein isoform X2 n=1 Tax=Stichopus japonicus TaxID=307972 RepID=UPI003AB87002
MFAKSVLLLVLLGVVRISTAGPLREETSEETIDLVQSDLDQDKNTDSQSETLTTVPSNSDEKQEVNKEVTNYQTIEVDGHSKIDEESPAEEENVLTEEEAQELLLELSNPAEVAQFIVASDDARGFLQALRLLTDQDYISLKVAYYLRDRVMEELRRMLMIQEMELSRTLLNNYQPTDFTQDQLPQDAPPAPYYEFNPFLQEEADYPQQEPYDVYEESLRQENSRALAEIAEAVAQKIANGDLTPENGVKIMNTVASLLPDSYWEKALELFADDNSYPLNYDGPGSDYSEGSLGSDVIEVIDDEDDEELSESSSELENELKDKNLRQENTLENQLMQKAHIKENQAMETEDAEKTIEEELTDEDYQAFFDWLEKEMGEVSQTDENEPTINDDDVTDKDGGSTEVNDS